MSTISYLHPPICYPSPHYRPHTSAYPSPSPSDSSQQPNGAEPSTPLPTNSTDLSRNTPSHSSHDSSSISCIDPELDSYAKLTAEDVVAAMRVVMSMQVKSAEDAQDHETNQFGHDYMVSSRSLEGDHMNNWDLEDRLNGLRDYSPSLERPEPMEHILTEDGEPMLNPGTSLQLFPNFCFANNFTAMDGLFFSKSSPSTTLKFTTDSEHLLTSSPLSAGQVNSCFCVTPIFYR
jgi:hypothetical protein